MRACEYTEITRNYLPTYLPFSPNKNVIDKSRTCTDPSLVLMVITAYDAIWISICGDESWRQGFLPFRPALVPSSDQTWQFCFPPNFMYGKDTSGADDLVWSDSTKKKAYVRQTSIPLSCMLVFGMTIKPDDWPRVMSGKSAFGEKLTTEKKVPREVAGIGLLLV